MRIPERDDVHQWSGEERARVARLLDEMVDRPTVGRRPPRARFLVILVTCVGAALLVPWIAFLSVSLPQSHSVRAWNVAWVGFDIALAVSLGFTGWWVVQRRQLAIVGLVVAATLLVCDAWFDICLSWNTSDQAWAFVGAAIELPIAALMAAERATHSSTIIGSHATTPWTGRRTSVDLETTIRHAAARSMNASRRRAERVRRRRAGPYADSARAAVAILSRPSMVS